MSIFHQHSHTKLKYCPNVINESGHKLGSLWWDIGDSLIRYRLNKSSKPLWKINKLTFTKAFGKSWKPLLNQNNLSPCLTFSLLYCRHVTNLTHQDNTYQSSMWSPLFVMFAIFLIDFTCIYFVSTFLPRGSSFVATESHAMHHLERTDDKPISRLIGPTHINK